jgi:hypothetical protein
VPDRLLVDMDRDGRARVSARLDGGLPSWWVIWSSSARR